MFDVLWNMRRHRELSTRGGPTEARLGSEAIGSKGGRGGTTKKPGPTGPGG